MPTRKPPNTEAAAMVMRNGSFQTLSATWFMEGGWQVFVPLLDHGHKTDLVVSRGPHYYRIQIKTIEDEHTEVEKRWKGSCGQFVVYVAKNSNSRQQS
jgi:hypothetical protein